MNSGPLSSRRAFGWPRPGHDLFEDGDHALRGQRRIHFDGQGLSHTFIQNIEGPKPSTAVQAITHEIHRPHHVRCRDHLQRLPEPNGEPSLRPAGQIQPQMAIHAPEPFVIPPMASVPQPIHIFPEPPAGLRRTQRRECLNDRGIALNPIDDRPIVRGSTKAHRLTRPLNWKPALSHQIGGDLPPCSRR